MNFLVTVLLQPCSHVYLDISPTDFSRKSHMHLLVRPTEILGTCLDYTKLLYTKLCQPLLSRAKSDESQEIHDHIAPSYILFSCSKQP